MKTRYLLLFVLAILPGLNATSASNPPECPNGLPNNSARLSPCDHEFDIFADLIVWTAKEAGADCWAEVIVSDTASFSNNLHQVDFGWDPGFRVGVGYGMNHGQWDSQVYYTWFLTKGTDSIASIPGSVHSTFLGNFYVDNPIGLGLSGPAYEKASIDWTIRFNIFDWELGRDFWVSKSLSLRPFMGVKGGWIDQSIHSKWENPNLIGDEFFPVGKEDLKNNFYGLGPSAGINTKWNLVVRKYDSFHLFGDFSAAQLWGHWSFKDRFTNDLHQQVVIKLQTIKSGASMLRAFWGFGWTHCTQKQKRLSTKLGYEAQFWLDQLQFYSFTGGRLVNELTLQGGTLEFCFDY